MRFGVSPAYLHLMLHSNPLQRNVIATLTRRLAVAPLYARAHTLATDQYPLPGISVIQHREGTTAMAPLFEHGPSPATRGPTADRYEVGRVEGAQPAGPPVGRFARARREHPPEDGLRYRSEERQASANNGAFSLNYR